MMQKNVEISSSLSISHGVVSSNSFFHSDDFDSDSSSTAAIDDHRRRRLYHSLVVQDHQEMVNRHSLCLNRLRQAAAEAAALRRENSKLRSLNAELMKRLSALIQSTLQNRLGSRSVFREKNFGTRFWDRNGEEGSVVESRAESVELDIYSRLPKSISVMSDDYLKITAQAIVNNGRRSRESTRSRTTTSLQTVKQKVYVGVGKKGNHGEDPIELEVYKQGAFKTELCNKWQETGECPYGDHCQFAHGIHELRPVIRHPRYKTQVCRMVLNGVVCPYGHRCHFLHAQADQKVK